MASVVEWFDEIITTIEQKLYYFWQGLVFEERKHPIILALALIIVLCVVLTLLCNLLCWFCYLFQPKQKYPGLIVVPQNYGSIPQGFQQQQDGKNSTFQSTTGSQAFHTTPPSQNFQVPAFQPIASTSAQYPILSV